jgi:hypothetical protein
MWLISGQCEDESDEISYLVAGPDIGHAEPSCSSIGSRSDNGL